MKMLNHEDYLSRIKKWEKNLTNQHWTVISKFDSILTHHVLVISGDVINFQRKMSGLICVHMYYMSRWKVYKPALCGRKVNELES